MYRRSTNFRLIFVDRGKNENKKMKIYETIQNSGPIMNFSDQKLKIKNDFNTEIS